MSPERRRWTVESVRRRLGHDKVSQRCACKALGQPRSTQRYQARQADMDRQMFAFEHHDVVPDILTLSKTIGGGVPIGITVISKEMEQTLADKGFTHITSHVSDPLPAAVALNVLDVIVRDRLANRAQELGQYLRTRLEKMATRFLCIGDILGKGLLVGIELVRDPDTREPANEEGLAITMKCLENGLSLNIVRHGLCCVLRIAPPLTVSRDESDSGLDRLEDAIADVFGDP